MGPGGDVASFLLAHTGELKLSDQQVTRLAAIARRSADRRQTAMRSMDSLMARGPQRRDSAARGRFAPSPELRATAERLRDQRHADLRDALGVLTPDQQATAWELSAMRGGSWMARGPMPGGFGGADGSRQTAAAVSRRAGTTRRSRRRAKPRTAPVRAPDRPLIVRRQRLGNCRGVVVQRLAVRNLNVGCIILYMNNTAQDASHRVRDQDRAGRGRAHRRPRGRRAARESARGGARRPSASRSPSSTRSTSSCGASSRSRSATSPAGCCCVRSNVTQLVDRLEADGLVKRGTCSEDRRAIRAKLTPVGQERHAAGVGAIRAVQQEIADRDRPGAARRARPADARRAGLTNFSSSTRVFHI